MNTLRSINNFGLKLLRGSSNDKAFKVIKIKMSQEAKNSSHQKKKKHGLNFAGVFTAITTPFNEDESIAYDKLQFNIQKWNKIPFDGYLIEGCTGEYVYLSTEEKLQLIKKSRELIGKDKILIGGSGCESTKETINLTKEMAALGVDAVMVVTPSYYKSKMTDEALIHHYETVADNSPIPIILYNVPIFTNIDMGVEAVAHLSKHPNIIGIKECSDSVLKISRLLEETKNEDFQLVVASAGILLPALHLGAVGTFCALTNVLGKEVCDLYQLYKKGPSASDEALALQNSLIHPNIAVSRTYGMAGLKEILDLKGFYGGPTRSPLLRLKKEELEDLKSIFKKAGHL